MDLRIQNKDQIKETENQMFISIMKSITMANEAIKRIEFPSEKDLVSSQSDIESQTNQQILKNKMDDPEDENQNNSQSAKDGELEYHKKALRSHE